jgi:hypothetical protein
MAHALPDSGHIVVAAAASDHRRWHMRARIRRARIHTAWKSYFHEEALIGLSADYRDVFSCIGWRQEPQTFNGICGLYFIRTIHHGGT